MVRPSASMIPIADLIRYIVAELSERGFDVTKTALVKLLYLADIEALRSGLPRVSNVQWLRYKYGPYAFEIEEAIRSIAGRDIDELAGISALGRAYKLYRSGGHAEEWPIPPEQRGIINTVVDRWGGEALDRLLNYAYFETEPMQDAEWGRPLNLALVAQRPPHVTLAQFLASRATPEDVRRLRQLKQDFRARASTRRKPAEVSPPPRYDEVLLAGLKATDKGDRWS